MQSDNNAYGYVDVEYLRARVCELEKLVNAKDSEINKKNEDIEIKEKEIKNWH